MQMIRRMNMSVLLPLILLFTGEGFAYTTNYTITDLGANLTPKAINNSGQVVGTLTDASGHKQASLFSNGVVSGLGTFGGSDSWGLGINDAGSIVGKYTSLSGDSHAFVIQEGQSADLFGAAGMIEATGINNNGEIIGTFNFNGNYWSYLHSILYNNGVITDISAIGENLGLVYTDEASTPRGLNNAGQAIIFQSMCGSYECDHSTLFSGGTVTGYPVGFAAYDMNDLGEVVGTSLTDWFHMDCFVYGAGGATVLTDLGGVYCEPLAINNLGQVVGTATDPNYNWHRFVYNNSSMADLQELVLANSGWEIDVVVDINDRGQIIGIGTTNGETHAFILTPEVQLVMLDIKPGDPSNIANPKAVGVLPVAILGSSVLDVTQVNPATVRVGGTVRESVSKRNKRLFRLEDVNGDNFMDAVYNVTVSQLYAEPDASSALLTLEAETFGGQKIYGEDALQFVPSK